MHVKSAIINTDRARLATLTIFVALALLFALPAHADHDGTTGPHTGTAEPSPQLTNNGIFGCLGRGAQVANVGTTRAVGGVYVPVNDAAVTLNTGYLVYKECILDGMARKISESGAAELAEQELTRFYQGRAGQAQYLQNYSALLQPYNIQITYNTVQDAQAGPICGAFRTRVASAVARQYAYAVSGRSTTLACTSNDAARSALIDRTAPVNWGSFMGLVGDYELGRYYQLREQNDARLASFNEDMRQMILAGRGVIPIFDNNQNPLAMNVVTPGYVIADSIGQAVTSGYRQLENANEIDQVVSNLFAGLTTRIVGSASGIPGLFVSTGNQPAYIDRMVAETRAAVRTGAVNAAVVALSGYRQAEAAYLEAKQGIATALLNTIAQLRSYENQCWELIIPAVQTYAQQNGNPTLNISTSTQGFAQTVIDNPSNNIRTLASTTAAEVTASQQALAQVDQLIAQVTQSGSSAAQQQALVQIDQMISNGTLHSQSDAQAAASARDQITSALNTLLNDTKTAWADNQDPNIGWCNVNNPAVVQRWFNAWR